MEKLFPRTEVGGISIPRIIIGSNWFLGFSHTSPAADSMIRERNGNAEALADTIEIFLNAGSGIPSAPSTWSPSASSPPPIEITLAALENRPPAFEGRASPQKNEIMKK